MGKTRESLQENERYQRNISCKDGHHKGHKWYGTTEAEDIKKRWQEYTVELYKKDLNDPDNHGGVVIHLKIDILEWEVQCTLGSITMNKASRSDGSPVELFQILKDAAVKVVPSICQLVGKLSSGHRCGKGQFSFQSQRKATPDNVQTPTQFHSTHTLAK